MNFLSHPHSKQQLRVKRSGGFGATEVIVSLGVGTLIITGAAVSLRSTESLVEGAEAKTTLRQNSTNGLRLARAEIEKSKHVIVHDDSLDEQSIYNIENPIYAASLQACKDKTPSNEVFNPIYGLSMSDIGEPVYYGINTSTDGNGYSIARCGAPLNLEGRYNETVEVFLARVIDNLAIMPCTDEEGECEAPTNEGGDQKSLKEIADSLDLQFASNLKTPERSFLEPAIRVETDKNYKLIRFIDAANGKGMMNQSYLEINKNGKAKSYYPLYLTAFARGDKRLIINENGRQIIDSMFFPQVESNRVAFVLDGSGSMSACILDGTTIESEYKQYWTGSNYEYRNLACKVTRMEAMQSELQAVLTDLHHFGDDPKISLSVFSSPGYSNHRDWNSDEDSLIAIGSNHKDNFDSAMAFVQSLNDGPVTQWGGTSPWNGLDKAFANTDLEVVYFLSDGEPNYFRNGSEWKNHKTNKVNNVIAHYMDINKDSSQRTNPLSVYSTALGLRSDWMEQMAEQSNGIYTEVTEETLTSEPTSNANNPEEIFGGDGQFSNNGAGEQAQVQSDPTPQANNNQNSQGNRRCFWSWWRRKTICEDRL